MSKSITRRAAVTGLATAPAALAASSLPVLAAGDPDATLFAAIHRWSVDYRAFADLCNEEHVTDETGDRLSGIAWDAWRRIAAMPAQTMRGVVAKAAAIREYHAINNDEDDYGPHDTYEELLCSLFDDAARVAKQEELA